MTFHTWFVDTAERALTTLVQAAVVYMLAASVSDSTFWSGLITACVIALANVLKSAIAGWAIPTDLPFALDVLIRTGLTFGTALLGAIASADWLDLIDQGWWTHLCYSAAIAALAVTKALLARHVTGTITPASLARAA